MEWIIILVVFLIGAPIEIIIALSIKSGIKKKEKKSTHIALFYSDDNLLLKKEYSKGEFVNFFTPDKENFVFCGWYDNPEFSGKVYTYFMVYDRDVSFYAKWEKNISI